MNSLLKYCEQFFDELELYEDISNNKTLKKDFLHAVINFLNDSMSTEKALKVYEVFSRSYWMINNDDSIIRMITEMKVFEENAGVLTEKQRDHFIHSINTFLLGVAIYISNSKYQAHFNEWIKHNGKYNDYYTTLHEEFLYRWGIASLFHDIAYPIEISYNQLKSYLNFMSSKCGLSGNSLEASVFITNVDVFNLLPKMNPKKEYEEEFFDKYPQFKEFETNSLSLIAMEISESFGINFDVINKELFDYINRMSSNKYVDHGYFSSLIVLRWFYHLVDNQEWNPVYFYFPIVNSATSIILHNYYRHGLMKAPFHLQQLNAKNHPLSYLLIMCDELQDWGRMPYGLKDKEEVYPTSIRIDLENECFNLKYEYLDSGRNGVSFASKKFDAIQKVLITDNIFSNINIE
ncbi:MAG: hypothetical protein K0Q49_2531 [Haloplasmataceae bacterium]|jgi:hypothetical protein|nr:hypothetical protein [Haloplasmataceae bacterium]